MSLEFPKVDLSGVNEAMENLNASLEKFAEDIQKRKDNAMAMEFTRVICDLLKENGVTVQMTEIKEENHATNKFEVKYGFAFTGFDFSEHDKKVTEEKDKKIEELERENNSLKERFSLLRTRCKPGIENDFDKWLYGKLAIVGCNEDFTDIQNKKIFKLEDRHRSDCIRINQLLTTIDVLTERYQKLREVHGA